MNTCSCSNPPPVQLDLSKYRSFCARLQALMPRPLMLGLFAEESVRQIASSLCESLLTEEIEAIRALLDDPYIGIAALDVPECELLGAADNAIFGVGIVVGMFQHIGRSIIRTNDGLPFTVHRTSLSDLEKIKNAGLNEFAPNKKLDFHNDALISKHAVTLPRHIAVYNMHIAYRRSGKFSWVPMRLWKDFDRYKQLAESSDAMAKIRLTPSLRINEIGQLEETGRQYLNVPIVTTSDDNRVRFYLNGNVMEEDNERDVVALFRSIRTSIASNPARISFDQKERRAIFVRNTDGFHARDVFEEPIQGLDLMRLFVRTVDENGEQIC